MKPEFVIQNDLPTIGSLQRGMCFKHQPRNDGSGTTMPEVYMVLGESDSGNMLGGAMPTIKYIDYVDLGTGACARCSVETRVIPTKVTMTIHKH